MSQRTNFIVNEYIQITLPTDFLFLLTFAMKGRRKLKCKRANTLLSYIILLHHVGKHSHADFCLDEEGYKIFTEFGVYS